MPDPDHTSSVPLSFRGALDVCQGPCVARSAPFGAVLKPLGIDALTRYMSGLYYQQALHVVRDGMSPGDIREVDHFARGVLFTAQGGSVRDDESRQDDLFASD
jgi:hypothetical protein